MYKREKIIDDLIEARAKRAYYAAKYNSTFWFPSRWDGEYEYWRKRDEELTKLIECL